MGVVGGRTIYMPDKKELQMYKPGCNREGGAFKQ